MLNSITAFLLQPLAVFYLQKEPVAKLQTGSLIILSDVLILTFHLLQIGPQSRL